MEKNSSQALDRFSHKTKVSKKFGRNFQEGPGGQIYFKMSQEPKTIEKKPWQEVGHGSQEYDLTINEFKCLSINDVYLPLHDYYSLWLLPLNICIALSIHNEIYSGILK